MIAEDPKERSSLYEIFENEVLKDEKNPFYDLTQEAINEEVAYLKLMKNHEIEAQLQGSQGRVAVLEAQVQGLQDQITELQANPLGGDELTAQKRTFIISMYNTLKDEGNVHTEVVLEDEFLNELSARLDKVVTREQIQSFLTQGYQRPDGYVPRVVNWQRSDIARGLPSKILTEDMIDNIVQATGWSGIGNRYGYQFNNSDGNQEPRKGMPNKLRDNLKLHYERWSVMEEREQQQQG